MLDSADDIESQSPRLIRFKLTQPLTPQPHTWRIISLQSVLHFNLSPEATPQQIHEADQILDSILVAYSRELFREPVSTTNTSVADELFRADKLIRHLRDLAPPAAGRANVVRQALAHLYPTPTFSVLTESDEFNPIPPLRDILPRARIGLVNPTPAFSAVEDAARSLLEYFLVPLLAEGGTMSAPPSHASPNFYTSRSRVPPDQAQTSSDHRISARAQCMQRDDSRCVITGALDPGVYDKLRRSGVTIPVGVMTAKLDAAHIIPHALNGGKEGVIKEENRFVWQVLEMFDPGVRLTLEGDKIDNPRNALMLDCTLHLMFGQLKWWLEEVPGIEDTYQPRTARRLLPSQVANHLTESGKYITFVARGGVEVPDPRLLRLHAACAKILDMSSAADYVDRLHFDAEELRQEHTLREDGSSNLYALLCARGLGIEVQ